MPTRQRLKELMISELMLDMNADEIGDDTPLFGPAGVGLDSVDALQLVVMMVRHWVISVWKRQPERITPIYVQSLNPMA